VKPGTSRARLALFLAFYLLAAAWALWVFVRRPGMDAYDKARFGDTIHGRAWRPFVGRVLVPWTVRAVMAVVPDGAEAAVGNLVRQGVVPGENPGYVDEYPFEFAVTAALLLLCLVGFALALRRLAGVTLGVTGWRRDVVPVPALVLLPCMYIYMNYVYDFPALFLFTLGLLMVAERRRAAFLAVFAVGCLNKETTILLSLVWFLQFRKRVSWRRLLADLGLQVLLWLGIRGGIVLLYRDRPGEMLEWWHLSRNLAIPSKILAQLRGRPFGQIVRQRGANFLALLAGVAVLASLRKAPVFLKRAFWIVVPLVVLMFFFGFFDELRDLYEFYPVAVLVLWSGALRLLRPRAGLEPSTR